MECGTSFGCSAFFISLYDNYFYNENSSYAAHETQQILNPC